MVNVSRKKLKEEFKPIDTFVMMHLLLHKHTVDIL